MNPRLMLVTDRNETLGRDLADVVNAAVSGGVDVVQVREKDLAESDLYELTGRVIDSVGNRATVVVNGNAEVALKHGVGLHLPGNSPAQGSNELSPWGRSIHSVEGAIASATESPEYLVLGTIFPTSSKPGHTGSGVSLIRSVSEVIPDIPVLAIGGISIDKVEPVILAGADGVAVRTAILNASDPAEVSRRFISAVNAAGSNR